jgi:Flp pilus assembly protein TadB
MDADEFFRAADRRRRKRFHQHPVLMHAAYLAAFVAFALVDWWLVGWTAVVAVFALGYAVTIGVVAVARLRRR